MADTAGPGPANPRAIGKMARAPEGVRRAGGRFGAVLEVTRHVVSEEAIALLRHPGRRGRVGGRHHRTASHRELDAAAVTGPHLRASYRHCRALHARHGRTYFLATRLLPAARRPAVHALYGFARHVDDLVDTAPPGADPETIVARIDALGTALRCGFDAGQIDHPMLAAVVHTATRFGIDAVLFERFLESMRMDLHVTDYPDRAALERYVHGSAEVIGLQMLPVLGTVCARERAAPHAAALGTAFQLTNFLRDVGEDLDRGRVYLPADELAAHGVDRHRLQWCRRTGRPDARVRAALADQVRRTRAEYQRARPGIALLHPSARPCVATAFTLYSRILDQIERRGHDVFSARVVVGTPERLALAGGALVRTAWARAFPAQCPGPWRTPMNSMQHLEYLLVLAACLAVTLPLELAGSRVYRRPRRLARALIPAAAFLAWDAVAINAGVWSISPRYTTGLLLPARMPLEEALFFVVIPVCALLTFETVRRTRLAGARL
jgi:phytoene synthase